MAVIEIEGLVKTYPRSGFTLQIDRFDLQQGSIMGLLGPNGSGKTTLLKLLMDYIRPRSGRISILGHDVGERKGLTGMISYMPENKNLYGHLRVGQMLDFAAAISPGWERGREQELSRIFDLEKNKKISTLSYGEKTQLYAVVCLAREYQVLILDEPTRGLDPLMQEKMLQIIKEESGRGKSILFSSHQIGEIEAAADSLALLKGGSIILKGDLDDMREEFFIIRCQAEDAGSIELERYGLEVAARRESSGQVILLCRGSAAIRQELEELLPRARVEKAGLKDIFLLLVEGKEETI